MADGYASKLKKGVWKGDCGLPEIFDSADEVEWKVNIINKNK